MLFPWTTGIMTYKLHCGSLISPTHEILISINYNNYDPMGIHYVQCVMHQKLQVVRICTDQHLFTSSGNYNMTPTDFNNLNQLCGENISTHDSHNWLLLVTKHCTLLQVHLKNNSCSFIFASIILYTHNYFKGITNPQ